MMMMYWKGEFLESWFQMMWKAREEGLGLGILEAMAFDQWEASILIMWSDLNQWEGSISTYLPMWCRRGDKSVADEQFKIYITFKFGDDDGLEGGG